MSSRPITLSSQPNYLGAGNRATAPRLGLSRPAATVVITPLILSTTKDNDLMTFPRDQDPPARLKYTLEEALDLLAALEEAAVALRSTDHYAELSQVEVRRLHGKLELGTNGGGDG